MSAGDELTPARVAPNRGDIEWCGLKALPVIAATFGLAAGFTVCAAVIGIARAVANHNNGGTQ